MCNIYSLSSYHYISKPLVTLVFLLYTRKKSREILRLPQCFDRARARVRIYITYLQNHRLFNMSERMTCSIYSAISTGLT